MGTFYKIDSDILTDIANAIRRKTGTSEPINVSDMAEIILSIPQSMEPFPDALDYEFPTESDGE